MNKDMTCIMMDNYINKLDMGKKIIKKSWQKKKFNENLRIELAL